MHRMRTRLLLQENYDAQLPTCEIGMWGAWDPALPPLKGSGFSLEMTVHCGADRRMCTQISLSAADLKYRVMQLEPEEFTSLLTITNNREVGLLAQLVPAWHSL